MMPWADHFQDRLPGKELYRRISMLLWPSDEDLTDSLSCEVDWGRIEKHQIKAGEKVSMSLKKSDKDTRTVCLTES